LKMQIHRKNGAHINTLTIPGPSNLYCAPDEPSHTEVLIGAFGYRTSDTHYRYDVATNDLTLVHKDPAPEDLSSAIIDIVWATSKDETRIPMTVIRLPKTERNGKVPVLMTGYGGYGVSMMPTFSTSALHWVRHGGAYVVTHLRGGGEFGQAWHDGGRLHNKQNTFDDFIACAETMIAEGWTRPERLAIEGGSNGGLLVTACMLQRPDLFGAVVANVPTTDMLRFHKFTAGGFWILDYGSPDDPEDFKVLRGYSPLHNVKSGAKYPPILITTGDHDDRVVPAHAYKFAATLQEIAHPDNVVLLRVDRRAGHGMGKPMEKIIAERADIDAFLVRALKLER
jgi:prolyl oligopeptidase